MDFSEKCAKDVDSAVKLALEDLQLSIDEVDVTVLEEPSRGFFGIGSKLALVRVEKKKKETKATKEPLTETRKPEAKRKENLKSSSRRFRKSDRRSRKQRHRNAEKKELRRERRERYR